MEKRLIDANAFKEYLRKGTEEKADIIPKRLVGVVLYIMDGLMLDIDEQPTVDAVPVVRCKDCKFAHMTYGGEWCKYCDMWESEESLYLDGDFFCAFGERRDDE